MSITSQVQKDMVESMKARQELRLSTLRMVKTALKNKEIDKRALLGIISRLKPKRNGNPGQNIQNGDFEAIQRSRGISARCLDFSSGLIRFVIRQLRAGLRPACIVATIGTTSTTSVDPVVTSFRRFW